MTCLPCPVSVAARRFAPRIAVETKTGGKSFLELDRDVTRARLRFSELGITAGERVVIQAENSYSLICAVWALFRIRAVACLINPRWPEVAVQNAAKSVDARFVFTELEALPFNLSTQETMPVENDDLSPPTVDDRVFATIVFSSGSTGSPKAIVHDLKAHLANAEGANENLPLATEDRWLLSLPLCHVAGYGILFRCILAGASVTLADPNRHLLEMLRDDRISHVSVVPTQFQQLSASLTPPPTTLQALLLGGNAWSSRQVSAAVDRGWPIYTTYGLSEMASQVTTSPNVVGVETVGTAGKILSRRQLRIADDNEILVRGETLFRGYLSHRSVELPVDSNGWFHTRDRGELDGDGCLKVLGRKDLMFISGGENIYPEEIEFWLQELPAIQSAVVVSVPDPIFGHRPIAFVAAERQQPEIWRHALTQSLPKFKVPDHFYPWPESCRRDLKPDRRQLADLAIKLSAGES
ncbi:MAG: o-succinylbenzoate--CoA ligase [Planctomycetaceae bacterium]|nr:o-succinylbenzoate--CoA ligase [Planctomycetaceae bacterium]